MSVQLCTVQRISKNTVDIIDLYFLPFFLYNQYNICYIQYI